MMINQIDKIQQQAQQYENIAQQYRKLQKYDESINFYKKALLLFQSNLMHDRKKIAQLLCIIGILFYKTNKLQQSLSYCFQCLKLCDTESKIQNFISKKVLYGIATIYKQQKKYPQSLVYFKKLIKEYPDSQDNLEMKALKDMANIYQKQREKNGQKLIKIYLKLIDFQKLYLKQNIFYLKDIFDQLISIYKIKKQYRNSIKYLKKILKIFKCQNKKYPNQILKIRFSIGQILYLENNFKGSFYHLKTLYKEFIRFEKQNTKQFADLNTLIGNNYYKIGQKASAVKFYKKSASLYQIYQNSSYNRLKIMWSLCGAYFGVGNYRQCIFQLQKMLLIILKRNMMTPAHMYLILARCYYFLHEHQKLAEIIQIYQINEQQIDP